MNVEAKQFRAAAGREPVALAGVLRTVLYALLGTRLDPRTLAEVVFVAETLTAMIVRHLVSPKPAAEAPPPSALLAPATTSALPPPTLPVPVPAHFPIPVPS